MQHPNSFFLSIRKIVFNHLCVKCKFFILSGLSVVCVRSQPVSRSLWNVPVGRSLRRHALCGPPPPEAAARAALFEPLFRPKIPRFYGSSLSLKNPVGDCGLSHRTTPLIGKTTRKTPNRILLFSFFNTTNRKSIPSRESIGEQHGISI